MLTASWTAVLFFLAAPVALAQVPLGPEFRINTYTTGGQPADAAGIAADAAGNFVVVWDTTQNGTDLDVFLQRYDAAGVPRGGEFQVNTYTTNAQWSPAVASDATGNFVVAWTREVPPFFNGAIFAQRFDRDGARRGAEFQVNSSAVGSHGAPALAADPVGNFLVTWGHDDTAGGGVEVYGRLFDVAGVPRGPQFRVNTYTTGGQNYPTAAASDAGAFVVGWSSIGQDGSSTGIFAQRFAPTGARVGGEFQVNTYTTNVQGDPSVAAAADGRFVFAWKSFGQDGSGDGVYARRFDASGAAVGGEFLVNTVTTSHQSLPRASADRNGNFVVAWQQADGTGYSEVAARRFDAAGTPRGAEFRVNTYTTGGQAIPQIAGDAAGNVVVTWTSIGQDGDGNGLFGQRFGGVTPAPTTVDPGGNGVFEAGETVAVQTAWRNVSGAPRAFSGTASLFTGPGAPNSPPYTIIDGTADYGVVPNGAVGSCAATGNCYSFNIGAVLAPTTRPVLHWDATFREDILPDDLGASITRRLHVGDSFPDVPRASGFYRFVEIILHHGLTGGCGGGNFCPGQSTPREQMAVFVLLAREGSTYVPPACVAGAERFPDVPASSPFCRWIEELERRGIVGGCGGGNFCPLGGVSREQMTVFALATRELAGYTPPACVAGAERFADVPASSPFCRWVEELERRGIIGGCGGGNFCPIQAVTREQNSVFVSGTFGLTLY